MGKGDAMSKKAYEHKFREGGHMASHRKHTRKQAPQHNHTACPCTKYIPFAANHTAFKNSFMALYSPFHQIVNLLGCKKPGADHSVMLAAGHPMCVVTGPADDVCPHPPWQLLTTPDPKSLNPQTPMPPLRVRL